MFLFETLHSRASWLHPTTILVSVDDGTQANDDSRTAAISAGGRFVAFSSVATNWFPTTRTSL